MIRGICKAEITALQHKPLLQATYDVSDNMDYWGIRYYKLNVEYRCYQYHPSDRSVVKV